MGQPGFAYRGPMRAMVEHLRASLTATIALTAMCGIAFPAVIWVFAQLFPDKAHGSLVTIGGVPRGSALIGQSFTAPHYFHGRPSAAGQGYDAASSGGSNLPPSSQTLRDLVHKRAEEYRAVNGLTAEAPVPVDALTASASGLDPDISIENASAQTPRVARARGLQLATVAELVAANTDSPTLGVIGRPHVNVLLLNLALDHLRPMGGAKP
jgi:potassium-transporting ATPase KdpC subunit